VLTGPSRSTLVERNSLETEPTVLLSPPRKSLFERIEAKVEEVRGTKIRRATYGEAIGILVLDTDFPRIPGDIGNATTYPFPVRLKVVRGIRSKDIVCEKPDISVCRRFIEQAKELEREGVRAITTSCGYFAYFQDEIADALGVPVFTSSLIQVPMIAKMLGKNKQVGIICANSKALTKTHLRNVGIDDSIRIAVAGLDKNWKLVPGPRLKNMIEGFDPKRRLEGFERALSKVTNELISVNPEIRALVFECTNFPPGAAAVQESTGLPVFDIITLLYMIHNALVRKRYSGYM